MAEKYFRRRVRLYANSQMRKELDKCIDYDRFLWNAMWAMKKEYNRLKEYDHDLLDEYRKIRNSSPWQLELPQYILNRVHNELIKTDIQVNTYNKETFEKKLKRKRKEVQFKRKRNPKASFQVPYNCISRRSYKPNGKDYTFGINLGEKSTVDPRYRMMRITELPPGVAEGYTKVTSATIIRDHGDYYVSFCLKVLKHKDIDSGKNSNPMGVDPGISSIMTLSNGKKFKMPKVLKKLEKKVKYYKSRMSKRRKSGVKKQSNRYNKARAKFVRTMKKIAHIKQDWMHKITTKLVNEFKEIHWEKCESSRMVHNPLYARSIYDASWHTLMKFLKYKCENRNNIFVEVDPKRAAATQTCSECGYRRIGNDKLTINDRMFVCPICGHTEDRDINAAKNIAKFN